MSSVEANVVYGMYSGLALLLNVYRPENPNGYGVILVSGSGWTAPLAYDAVSLKDIPAAGQYALPLQKAGYTVFAVNHRAAPRFHYPAALEDVQRAVRFIRHHAARYGIRPEIGAVGGSSGGHLVSLLGVLDGVGDSADPDPVNRESARVQCVVARAAPVDLLGRIQSGSGDASNSISFMGMAPRPNLSPDSVEWRTFREASPINYVSKGSPPFLLIHGDADSTVPFEQSVLIERALRNAGVEVKLLCIKGGQHGPEFPGAIDPPDYLGEMIAWFDRHLCITHTLSSAT